jgi:UDP-2,4-diacetamido-2,4,6-trideoxy-beta-L-altropyranose hydrolase
MNIFIRCDGSYVIGSGHVIRMIALADQFRKLSQQTEIFFLMRPLSDAMIKTVQNHGFRVLVLPGDRDTFEVSHVEEIHFLRSLDGSEDDLFIIDHYGYDADFIHAVGEIFDNIVLIDDFQPDRCAPDAVKILINPGFSAYRVTYDKVPGQLQLLGPQYALLREQFSRRDHIAYQVRETCENILLCFGGSDLSNLTAPFIHFLEQITSTRLNITAVYGPNSTPDRTLSLRVTHHDIQVKQGIADMAAELLKHDLAVIPASTLALEAASLGVPAAILICEENQRLGGIAMQDARTACLLGYSESLDWGAAQEKMVSLLTNFDFRRELSLNGKKTVNANGANLAAKTVLQHFKIN